MGFKSNPITHKYFSKPSEISVGQTVVVQAQVEKEFLNMRQNEREIWFIRIGDAIRTAGQLKGESTLNGVLSPLSYPRYKEWDRVLQVIC